MRGCGCGGTAFTAFRMCSSLRSYNSDRVGLRTRGRKLLPTLQRLPLCCLQPRSHSQGRQVRGCGTRAGLTTELRSVQLLLVSAIPASIQTILLLVKACPRL